MRCPIHGPVNAGTGDARCPVTIRRTIAGEVIVGTCDQPLETDDDD